MEKRVKLRIKLVLIYLAIVLVIRGIYLIKKTPVLVSKWNAEDETYKLCTIRGKTDYDASDYTAYFKTGLSYEKITESNAEAYLGEKTLVFYRQEYEAAVFFDNDNYYYFYKAKGMEKYYYAGNLSAGWRADRQVRDTLRFPFPDVMSFHDIEHHETEDKEFFLEDLAAFFDRHNFEDMKEFYSRLSGELCAIDEENQTITVKAYGKTTDENGIVESGCIYDIVIDCKNRSVTGPGKDGSPYTINCG